MATKIKEVELFKPIKQFFENRDYEVYSEVLFGQGGSRADVVAKQNNIISVIEMKTSLSLDLLEQANRWIHYAHYVYIAVPMPKDRHINEYARKCLIRDGIGLLVVDFNRNRFYYDNDEIPMVWNKIDAKLCRKIINHWDKYLTEAHKNTLPGGTKGGGYITPYKITIDGVKRCLKLHPEGLSLNELVKRVETHYSNPKQGLYQALTSFETDWCETFTKGITRYFKIKPGIKINLLSENSFDGTM
jgi:hypothetical protein